MSIREQHAFKDPDHVAARGGGVVGQRGGKGVGLGREGSARRHAPPVATTRRPSSVVNVSCAFSFTATSASMSAHSFTGAPTCDVCHTKTTQAMRATS